MYTIERVIRLFDGKEGAVKFITGVGNLTADILAREVTTKDNKKISVVGGFGQSVAFNYWENGEQKPVFFPVEAWGKTAENLGKLGKKGAEVVIIGRLENRTYKNQANKTYVNETLVIERFLLTSRAREKMSEQRAEGVNISGFKDVV